MRLTVWGAVFSLCLAWGGQGIAGDVLVLRKPSAAFAPSYAPAGTQPICIGGDCYDVIPESSAAALKASGAIESYHTPTPRYLQTNDTYFSYQWYLENTGQTVNGEAGTAGADIDGTLSIVPPSGERPVVAVIDSGIDCTHPDLTANIYFNTAETPSNGIDDDGNGYTDDYCGFNFYTNSGASDDLLGHGTHVAGIIAAEADNGVGIAGVSLNSAEVLNINVAMGSSTALDPVAIYRGLAYIEKLIIAGVPIKVVNMSYGGSTYDELEYAWMRYLEGYGVLFVVAAGNEGADLDTDGADFYPAEYGLANQITVGASDMNDEPADFSNYGRAVTIAAPGYNIASTYPGGLYAYESGTSMAAPMVSGVAASVAAANPALEWFELKNLIQQTSDGVISLASLAESGHRLNHASARAAAPSVQPAVYAPGTGGNSGGGMYGGCSAGQGSDFSGILLLAAIVGGQILRRRHG